jgi:hypothetical protein
MATDARRHQRRQTPAWADSTIFCHCDDNPLVVLSAACLPCVVRPLPPLVVSSASRSPCPAPSAPPLSSCSIAFLRSVNIATALSLRSPSPPWNSGGQVAAKKRCHLPPHNSANQPTHHMRGVIQKILAMGINMIKNIQETKNILFGSLVGSRIKK